MKFHKNEKDKEILRVFLVFVLIIVQTIFLSFPEYFPGECT